MVGPKRIVHDCIDGAAKLEMVEGSLRSASATVGFGGSQPLIPTALYIAPAGPGGIHFQHASRVSVVTARRQTASMDDIACFRVHTARRKASSAATMTAYVRGSRTSALTDHQ